MNKKDIEAVNPLSPAQQGMLYESIRAPASGIHIEQLMYSLRGEINRAAFEQAWQWGVDQHAILRTGFVWKEQVEPLQVTLRHVHMALDYQDCRHLSSTEQQVHLESYLRGDRVRGFNVAQAPLMRLTLFRLDEQSYRFAWTLHHILMDGWSRQIVLNEIISCYAALRRGQTFSLPPSRPYSEYITWLKKQDVSEAEGFWRKMLHGFIRTTPLGREQVSDASDQPEKYDGPLQFQLSDIVTTSLQSVARSHQLTLNTLLQGLWALLLGRYSQSEDVVFGVTVSGRPADMVGVETIVGLCLNTLPLRVQLPAQSSLWSWLSDLQRLNLEMLHYEYCSAGQIHRWSDLPGMSLLYESILVVENYPSVVPSAALEANLSVNDVLDIGAQTKSATLETNLSVNDVLGIGAQTKYALTVLVSPGTRLGVRCMYNTRMFPPSSARHIMEHLQQLLEYITSDPHVQLATLSNLIPADQIPIVRSTLPIVQEKFRNDTLVPRNPMEELVAAIWCDVLGMRQVGVETDFFALGGHSLVATQMVSRLHAVLNVEIPLRAVFESPTVEGLALRAEQALRKREVVVVPPLRVVERPERLPPSFAQQRLWFLDQLEPESTAYLVLSVLRVEGKIDVHALERSMQELVCRHESLRTVFVEHAGQPVQVIKPIAQVRVPVIDLQGLTTEQREAQVRQLARQEGQRPCDLAQGPLLRTALLRLEPDSHMLLLTLHHIITDGWSHGVLVRELTSLYRAFVAGQPSPLLPLPIQYADYALWQRQWLQGETLQRQIAYWKEQLWRVKPLELPTDVPRAAVQGRRGALHTFTLPGNLFVRFQDLGQKEGVTLFMALLAAFQVLLARYSGQEDIVVGTDIANRTQVETEGLIGFFANQLVLRSRIVAYQTFRELLCQVRKTTLDAYLHQDLPFEKIVEVLRPERRLQSNPLFSVKMILKFISTEAASSQEALKLSGVKADTLFLPMEMTAKLDLTLWFFQTSEGVRGAFDYNADLFKATTIERMAQHFLILLEHVSAKPDDSLNTLEMFTKEETGKQHMQRKEREATLSTKLKSTRPTSVRLGHEQLIRTEYLSEQQSLPLVIQPQTADVILSEWAQNHMPFIEAELRKHGALLFRGFQLPTPADFERFALVICPDLFRENGEHVPAKDVGSGSLYTPVFYAPDKKLLWHNENSFNAEWPMKILFHCARPADQGGETPIADSRKVFQLLDPAIKKPFVEKGIMYVRTYGEGLGLSWQTVFRTTDKQEVEARCRKDAIDFVWKEGDRFQTRQVRPAVLAHPHTGEMVWWNQAPHWHPAFLDPDVRAALLSLFAPENLPRNCFYGDGTPIEDAVMDAICCAYEEAEICFPWKTGDILMLDNMLVAHARNPYHGERKIYVSLGNMNRLQDR